MGFTHLSVRRIVGAVARELERARPVARAQLIQRNVALNLVGLAFPLTVALLSLPLLIQRLGVERFAILSLLWVVFNYMPFLDLGLGRATTRLVAQTAASASAPIGRIARVSLVNHLIVGSVFGALFLLIAPQLAAQFINTDVGLQQETAVSLVILAPAIMVSLIGGAAKATLEGVQRFGLVNAISGPSNALTYLLPLGASLVEPKLPFICALLLLNRAAAGAAFLYFVLRRYPDLGATGVVGSIRSTLVRAGAWLGLANLSGVVMAHAERFILVTLGQLAAVPIFTVPFDVITRLWILPSAIASALFPVFSARQPDSAGSREIYTRTLKHVCILCGVVITVAATMAEPVLEVLFGPSFARSSVPIAHILAVGVFAGSIGYVPTFYMQSAGRARLLVAIYVLELPPLLILSWILIKQWGPTGAAVAWSTRISIDAFLTSLLASIHLETGFRVYFAGFAQAILAIGILALVCSTAIRLEIGWQARVALVWFVVFGFGLVVHRLLFDDVDRSGLARIVGR